MFSPLQQHILAGCSIRRDKINRDFFESFYDNNLKIKLNARTKIITQSLERLIDRGFLIGYGIRTPKKWFIKEVRITRLGTKQWGKFLERNQKRLPL
jgi:hypothetical protein